VLGIRLVDPDLLVHDDVGDDVVVVLVTIVESELLASSIKLTI
jgi:hypothetical protein